MNILVISLIPLWNTWLYIRFYLIHNLPIESLHSLKVWLWPWFSIVCFLFAQLSPRLGFFFIQKFNFTVNLKDKRIMNKKICTTMVRKLLDLSSSLETIDKKNPDFHGKSGFFSQNFRETKIFCWGRNLVCPNTVHSAPIYCNCKYLFKQVHKKIYSFQICCCFLANYLVLKW